MNLYFRLKTLVLTAAALTLALPAMAQWQWIDKDGHKVFSDQAPPSDVKEKDILKRPGVRITASPPANDQASVSAARASTASAPKPAAKETELEAKKKQAEKDEAVLKKAENEKQAKARQENCESAKVALQTLQSGVRIATTNAAGEREIIDDAKRADQTKRAMDVADTNCKR